MYANRRNFRVLMEIGPRNTTVTSDFRPEVEIRPFRACAMHPAIIIGTVRSLWTWLWGRYYIPQNAFLVTPYERSFILFSEKKRTVGRGRPLLPKILGQPTPVGTKSLIMNR